MPKLTVTIPILVEGRYDKARLSGVVDGVILTSDGFGIFKNEEKKVLLRRLGQRGLILFCDSDGGGRLIRSHLRGMLGGLTVYDLYTPEIKGKEPRKRHASAAGNLGVEGVDNAILADVVGRFLLAHPEFAGDGAEEKTAGGAITKSLLYELGLNGTPDAAERRAAVAGALGLPHDMTANAFAAAVSMLCDETTLRETVREEEAKRPTP